MTLRSSGRRIRCRLGPALALLVSCALAGAGAGAAPATRVAAGAAGRIVFTSDRDGGYEIYAVNPDGTGLTQLTHDRGEDASPVPSPDGKLIAWESGEQGLVVMDADGSRVRELPECSSGIAWSPDSKRLVCQAQDALAIVDVVADEVTPLASNGTAAAWSPDGRTIAFADDGLWVVPAAGGARRKLAAREVKSRPSWSPDSRRLAYVGAAGRARPLQSDLFAIGVDGSGERLLVRNVEESEAPEWSPDGSLVAFTKDTASGEGPAVALVRPDGGGFRLLNARAAEASSGASWSADGTRLLYERQRYRSSAESDVFVSTPRGGPGHAATSPFPEGGTNEHPRWDAGPRLTTAPRPGPRALSLPRARTLTFPGFEVDAAPPALAADGARAATADERCGVLVWEPLARRTTRMRNLCSELRVEPVVLAGRRLAWITQSNGNTEESTELVTARIGARRPTGVTGASAFSDDGFDTFESGATLYGLQGGGGTIAFTVSRYGRGGRRSAWLLLARHGAKCPNVEWKARSLCRRLQGAKDGVTFAVDARRVVTVAPGGVVRLVSTSGKLLHRWALGGGLGPVRLQGRTLAVQRGASLALYDTATGAETTARRLVIGEGTAPVLLDVQGDLAAYATGGAIHVLRLRDGRDRALALPEAAGPLDARIESSGLFVLWNRMHVRRFGRMTFVPLRTLRQALGR